MITALYFIQPGKVIQHHTEVYLGIEIKSDLWQNSDMFPGGFDMQVISLCEQMTVQLCKSSYPREWQGQSEELSFDLIQLFSK